MTRDFYEFCAKVLVLAEKHERASMDSYGVRRTHINEVSISDQLLLLVYAIIIVDAIENDFAARRPECTGCREFRSPLGQRIEKV